jgi:hypothetical protein
MYDDFGCCVSCGYSYCDILNKCIRIWETPCSNHRILTQLDNFNINELMLFIIGVMGALGGLCLIIQKSKCKTLDICCIKIVRDTELIKFEDKLEKGLPPTTPKPTLDLIEPEPETENP